MTTRRQALRHLSTLAVSAAAPLAVGADAPKRIGVLSEAAAQPGQRTLLWEPAFWTLMAERGWLEGQGVVVERAFAETRSERLPRLAEELVRKRVDLIVCYGDQEAMVAAARATTSIPIVVFDVLDPIEQGLVDSYARPGRNVTGICLSRGSDLALKRLQFLRAIAPSARRLCWLWGHDGSQASRVDGSRYDVAGSLAAAARSLQFETRVFEVTGPVEIDKALADAAAWGAQALTSSGLPPYLARAEMARFAIRQRWPSAFAGLDFVESGGLLSYGVSDTDNGLLNRRWVDYVDRILRGASPATLPVISADRYELTINVKTAEAIGVTLPASLLSRADGLVR